MIRKLPTVTSSHSSCTDDVDQEALKRDTVRATVRKVPVSQLHR